ncbi:MAG TPA: PAS domain S-box protein, partial [Sphingobacteriaceae bacterium]
CQIVGSTRDELLKMRFTDLTHPDDRKADANMLKMLVDGAKDVFYHDKRYRHRDGHDVWVSVCVSAVRTPDRQLAHVTVQIQDITDRVKMRTALERSRQHYKSLFEQNPDAVFSLNTDGYFTTVNNATVELSGYSREQLLVTHFSALCLPDDLGRIQSLFMECLAGKAFSFEMTKVTATNTKRLLSVTVMPVRVNHVIEGIYGIAKDITAIRKQHRERDLMSQIGQIFGKEENVYLCLASVLHELCRYMHTELGEVWTTNMDGTELHFSSRYDALEDHITDDAGIFSSLADRSFRERQWKRSAIAGRTYTSLPVTFNQRVIAVFVIGDGDEPLEFLLGQNVLDQLANHLQRKRSEDELNQYFRMSHDMLFILGYDGYFKKINPAFTAVLGYSENELLERPFIEFVFADDLKTTENLGKRIRNGEPVHHFKNRYVTKSGQVRWLEWNTTPIRREKMLFGIARDVTSQETMEREIWRQQRQFAALFEEAPVSMAILKGPDLIFESANALYYKLTGKKNIIGKTVKEVFPEVHGQGYFEKLDHTYKTGRTITEPEARITMKSDETGNLEEVFMNYMLQPYLGMNGEIEGIFYFGMDVTWQVQARRKIEESEQRYSELIQNLPVAFFTTDLEGRIMLYNKSAVALWGRKPQVGRDIWCDSWDTCLPDLTPLPAEDCPTAITLRTRMPVRGHDLILKYSDGDYRHILPHPSPLFNARNELTGVMNILIDITERKRAEEELNKLSLIAKKTVNAVLFTDPEGKIEWVNEAFTRITEYSFEEAVGRTASSLLHGEGTESTIKNLKAETIAKREAFEGELLKYTKSGRPFWVEVHTQPLFDASGRLVRFFEIETDITERKVAYEKLVKAKNETSSFARQLNNVLEEERNRISREMHDEFGQQLAGLKMSLASLRKHAADDPKIVGIVNSTLADADHAIQTLRRIATDLRPGILDTLGLFAAVEWLVSEFKKKSGIECTFSVNGMPRNPDKDISICFFRICQEALTNVMRHAAASRIIVELVEVNGILSMTIADNGKGFPHDIIHDAFSMGLIGMRERASLIGGKLDIKSELNTGTTVQLTVALSNA